MNGQELATAAQYGCDLLVIVVDNARLRHDPHAPGARVSGPRLGTDLANPDFAALARAYGGWAERVETTDAIRRRADRSQGPRRDCGCSIW